MAKWFPLLQVKSARANPQPNSSNEAPSSTKPRHTKRVLGKVVNLFRRNQKTETVCQDQTPTLPAIAQSSTSLQSEIDSELLGYEKGLEAWSDYFSSPATRVSENSTRNIGPCPSSSQWSNSNLPSTVCPDSSASQQRKTLDPAVHQFKLATTTPVKQKINAFSSPASEVESKQDVDAFKSPSALVGSSSPLSFPSNQTKAPERKPQIHLASPSPYNASLSTSEKSAVYINTVTTTNASSSITPATTTHTSNQSEVFSQIEAAATSHKEAESFCLDALFTTEACDQLEDTTTGQIGKHQFFCKAQSQLEIDTVRRMRSQFAKLLKESLEQQEAASTKTLKESTDLEIANIRKDHDAALVKKQEAMEKEIEESYTNTEKLHEIFMTNAQEDHEAALKEERDISEELRAQLQPAKQAYEIAKAEISGLNQQLVTHMALIHDQEATLKQRTNATRGVEDQLDQALDQKYKAEMERNTLSVEKETLRLDNQRQQVNLQQRWNELSESHKNLQSENQDLTARFEERDNECTKLRTLYDGIIEGRVRDWSNHAKAHINGNIQVCMTVDEEINKATVDLRALVAEREEEIEQLRSANTTNINRASDQLIESNRIIRTLKALKTIETQALVMIEAQRVELLAENDRLQNTLTNKLPIDCDARPLVELLSLLKADHAELMSRYVDKSVVLDRVRLQNSERAKHDARSIKLRDDKIASLHQELEKTVERDSEQQANLNALQHEIDEKLPGLENDYNALVEFVKGQVEIYGTENHRQIIRGVGTQLLTLQDTNGYLEDQLSQQFLESQANKQDLNWCMCCSLQMETEKNDEISRLEALVGSYQKRFEDELQKEPLTESPPTKVRKQVDYENDVVDKEFYDQTVATYHAIPMNWIYPDGSAAEFMKADEAGTYEQARFAYLYYHEKQAKATSGDEVQQGLEISEQGEPSKQSPTSGSSCEHDLDNDHHGDPEWDILEEPTHRSESFIAEGEKHESDEGSDDEEEEAIDEEPSNDDPTIKGKGKMDEPGHGNDGQPET